WLGRRVRFCSSLVDRITTGMPAPDVRAALERRLAYTDALLTVTEPHALWAIEADPAELRATFAIDVLPESVIIAPDIGFYRVRKLRLLNGAHTATASLALLAGVRTVREAAEHPRLGAFLRHILFEEILPATDLPADAALAFAETVIDRFRNPWLDHEWRVIAANQTAKLRLRVVPSLTAFARKRGTAPHGLTLSLAAYLRWARSHPAGAADLPRARSAAPERCDRGRSSVRADPAGSRRPRDGGGRRGRGGGHADHAGRDRRDRRPRLR